MKNQTQERKQLVRFAKIMTIVFFGKHSGLPESARQASQPIDWENAPMQYFRIGVGDFIEMAQDISGDALEQLAKADELLHTFNGVDGN